jgi:hypothetical protein
MLKARSSGSRSAQVDDRCYRSRSLEARRHGPGASTKHRDRCRVVRTGNDGARCGVVLTDGEPRDLTRWLGSPRADSIGRAQDFVSEPDAHQPPGREVQSNEGPDGSRHPTANRTDRAGRDLKSLYRMTCHHLRPPRWEASRLRDKSPPMLTVPTGNLQHGSSWVCTGLKRVHDLRTAGRPREHTNPATNQTSRSRVSTRTELQHPQAAPPGDSTAGYERDCTF